MFVIKISNIDCSSHTLEMDALAQKQRYIDGGIDPDTIQIVEQTEFNPPQDAR